MCLNHAIDDAWTNLLLPDITVLLHDNNETTTDEKSFNGLSPQWVHYVSIGVADSGVDFHAHSMALFSHLHGSKFWILFPPHTISDDRQEQRQCLIQSGEMIFIPEGWTHATYNVEDAVGMSLQVMQIHGL